MVWVSRAIAQLPGYVGTVASKPLVSSGCQTSSRQDLFGEIVYGREQRGVISHHYSSHWIGTFMHQYNSISSMFSMILGRCKFAIWDNSVNSIVWGFKGISIEPKSSQGKHALPFSCNCSVFQDGSHFQLMQYRPSVAFILSWFCMIACRCSITLYNGYDMILNFQPISSHMIPHSSFSIHPVRTSRCCRVQHSCCKGFCSFDADIRRWSQMHLSTFPKFPVPVA